MATMDGSLWCAIEMANFYDQLTGGEAGKAFTLTPHKERFDVKDADEELRKLVGSTNMGIGLERSDGSVKIRVEKP